MDRNIIINSFTGRYAFLSNFAGCRINCQGIIYHSAEAAFQAAKSNDPFDRMLVANMTPAAAKKWGRNTKLPNCWEDVKDNIMYEVVKAKFVQNSNLRELLLKTGDAWLIEGSTWNDTYWGQCDGLGWNKLGEILMQVRKELHANVLPTK